MIFQKLEKALAQAARDWAKSEGLALPAALELSPPPAHIKADVSVPWALAAAKAARKNPLEVAKALAEVFARQPDVAGAQPAPPGFVNITLKPEALTANLQEILQRPSAYGRELAPRGDTVLIEFVSANPTGPLHMASGRGATLGDSLVRILNRLGRKAAAEYYVNDGGARVELLGKSIRARYKDEPVPEGGYQGDYLKDLAAAAPAEAAQWGDVQWGRYAMDVLLASHKKDMDDFGVRFDRWFHESELYERKEVEAALAFLKGRGMVYEKESAVWLGTAAAEGSSDDKDRVLVKSDGRPTYFLPDIAYHKSKYDRGFDSLIDIFGADHHGYVPRMKAAIAALGKAPESYHAIVHQLVHLFRGKEAVKMSKRAGTFVSLREILDEVGVDACRFFFAMRTPDSHLNFDLELAKTKSSENPVFYCQYVHARICSIFKEAEKAGIAADASLAAARLRQPEERALLLKLGWFPAALKTVERDLSPHALANYILELAGLYHPFYEKCRVVDPQDKALSAARLALCGGVREIIREGLGLLGVSAPESM